MAYSKITWVNNTTPLSATNMNIHSNAIDSLRIIPTAGGTGTAITVTDYKVTLTDGVSGSFVASASNSAAATTINFNSLGAKSFYKPGGTDAPNIISGKAYSYWYSSSGDCFFVKASATGDAVAADVLATKIFSSDNDTDITGTMPNNGAVEITPSWTADVSIDAGYHNGSGIVVPPVVTEGDKRIYSEISTVQLQNDYYTKVKEALINLDGTYRVMFYLQASNYATAYGQVYINGVATGIERATGESASYTEDFELQTGDKVQIYGKYVNNNQAWVTFLVINAAFAICETVL